MDSRLNAADEIRRRLQDELAQEIGGGVEFPVECVIPLAVGATELGDVASGATLRSKEISAIQRGNEILRAALDDLQAVLGEAKIGDDLWIQQADRICRDRVPEPRKEFLGDRRSAHDRSPLEDLDLDTCHAEIGGAGEPVVTRTDDDDIIALHRCE